MRQQVGAFSRWLTSVLLLLMALSLLVEAPEWVTTGLIVCGVLAVIAQIPDALETLKRARR
jgi:CDP-diglyceride synthetase